MSRLALPTLWVLACGCTGSARVAEEMQGALLHTNEALALALVATEPFGYAIDPLWTVDDGLRHPASGPCPSDERDTDDPDTFVAELDYGDGCLPRSGLLPTIVSGGDVLASEAGRIDVVLEGLVLALANPVIGTMAGTVVVADGVDEDLELSGDVSVETDEGPYTATLDLTARLSPDEVVFDGLLELEHAGRSVRFDALRLPYQAILGECPRPVTGTALVTGGDVDLEVEFVGDDAAVVTRGRRISDPTSSCAFDSVIFSG